MVCRMHWPAVVRRWRGQIAATAIGLLVMATGCGRGAVLSPETSTSGEPRRVQTALATRQPVTRTIIAVGELVAREDATLSVKVSGRLHRIEVDLGDSVAQDQLLAQVEPRDYELELDRKSVV